MRISAVRVAPWIIIFAAPAILAVLCVCAPLSYGGQERSFYGKWKPPASLQGFWAPIDDSWWKTGQGLTPKLSQRCREFAKNSRPDAVISDMIRDLHAEQSEVRWFVYLHIMLNWRRDTVLGVLKPFQQSANQDVRHIADEFAADVAHPSDY
jgi:hypothetical protein